MVGRGYTALKAGGLAHPVQTIHDLRTALGDEIDLCIDVHGPPWYSVPDAIRVAQELEEYDLLFYEDPDICWRAWLVGSEVWYVPRARVTHHYTWGTGTGKWFYLAKQ